jgi:hypothetical protein
MQPPEVYEKQVKEKFLHSGVSFFHSGKEPQADFSSKTVDSEEAQSLPIRVTVTVLRMCA